MVNKPLIAQRVATVFGVLAAVELDHESLLSTNKIHNIRPDWLLTHEFEPREGSGTEVSPQFLFGLGRVSP